MSPVRIIVIMVAMFVLGAGRSLWSTYTLQLHDVQSVPPLQQTTAIPDAPDAAPHAPDQPFPDATFEPPPRYDMYGNEIEVAVEDYRIDIRGSVYERHSPDTAVSRLNSPST